MGKIIPTTVPDGLMVKHIDAFPIDADGNWHFRLHFPEGTVELELDLSSFQTQIKDALNNRRKEKLT